MKKKYSLTTLAALGLMSGLMAAETAAAEPDEALVADLVAYNKHTQNAPCTPPTAKQETWLFSKINSESKKLYNSMDCEGKSMAMGMAEQKCAGKNKCAGQNSCKTDQNACAGQATCQGMSNCAFKDKNKAVQTAAKTMAKKRNNMMRSSKNTMKQKG